MGMYTEIIFGATLKDETPVEVITILKHLVEGSEIPAQHQEHKFFETSRCRWICTSSSYYFPGRPEAILEFEPILQRWYLQFRSNLKNYDQEIEMFLDWVKPYIEQGSGNRDFYAVVTKESDAAPTVYYLEDRL